jgi:hypothetical protein
MLTDSWQEGKNEVALATYGLWLYGSGQQNRASTFARGISQIVLDKLYFRVKTLIHQPPTPLKKEEIFSVSKQTGFAICRATPEMAKQMPNIFKAGDVYLVQRATAVALGDEEPKVSRSTSKKHSTRRGSAKTTRAPRATKRKPVKPEIILQFVRENAGCNMTDIERDTRMPQAGIRRVLNSAREDGTVRTEGQRRGLRYFAGSPEPIVVVAGVGREDGSNSVLPSVDPN